MNTVSPQAKLSTEKRLTTLFLTNSRNNSVVPKTLKWDDISLLESWTLSQAIPIKPLENKELQAIVEHPNGEVEIIFSTSKRMVIA